jgi:hypothetical protein
VAARINWGQAAAEVALLALGVATALGVDAYADGRSAIRQEQEYLRSLAQDFAETRRSIFETVRQTEEVRDTVMAVLSMVADGSIADLPPEELNTFVSGSFWYHGVEPSMATYNDLVNSGAIGLIRSAPLRLAMNLMVEDLHDVEVNVSELSGRWATLEEPYLVEHFVISQLYQGYRGARYPVVSFSPDRAAVESREFANILAGRVILMQDIIGNCRVVLDDLDRVDALLQAALVEE